MSENVYALIVLCLQLFSLLHNCQIILITKNSYSERSREFYRYDECDFPLRGYIHIRCFTTQYHKDTIYWIEIYIALFRLALEYKKLYRKVAAQNLFSETTLGLQTTVRNADLYDQTQFCWRINTTSKVCT